MNVLFRRSLKMSLLTYKADLISVMQESICHEMVLDIFKKFSCIKCLFFALI